VIMAENSTRNDGSTAYKVRGLSLELLKLVCEKMKLIAVFLVLWLNMEIHSFVKGLLD